MIVKENINFERGLDPKEAMGIGTTWSKIRKKYLKEAEDNIQTLYHSIDGKKIRASKIEPGVWYWNAKPNYIEIDVKKYIRDHNEYTIVIEDINGIEYNIDTTRKINILN